jgi:hypothetical protein
VPSPDHTVKLQNLLLEPAQLCPEGCETRARYLWNSLVTWIGDDIEQFLNTIASDRSDDPELSKMGADRIDH